jgi:hypothetical protein
MVSELSSVARLHSAIPSLSLKNVPESEDKGADSKLFLIEYLSGTYC